MMKKPKEPYKPNKPFKPRKPSTTVKVAQTVLDLAYNDFSVQSIIDAIKDKEPNRPLSDFIISLDYERGYYDGIELSAKIIYEVEVPNKHYKKQLAQYNENIKKYKVSLEKWKEENKVYLIELKKYKKLEAEYIKHDKKLTITRFKKRIKELEKEV